LKISFCIKNLFVKGLKYTLENQKKLEPTQVQHHIKPHFKYWLLAWPGNIKLALNNLPGTNNSFFAASRSEEEKKVF